MTAPSQKDRPSRPPSGQSPEIVAHAIMVQAQQPAAAGAIHPGTAGEAKLAATAAMVAMLITSAVIMLMIFILLLS